MSNCISVSLSNLLSLRVMCFTFNAGTLDPPYTAEAEQQMREMLRLRQNPISDPQRPEDAVDVYAVGFQEVSSRFDRYLMDLFRTVDLWTKAADRGFYENGYKRVARIRLLGIVLCIYILNK